MRIRVHAARRALCLALATTTVSVTAAAASISTGRWGLGAQVSGAVMPGDVDRIREAFGNRPPTTLTLDIAPGSEPQALVQMAAWLREAQPLVSFKGSCAGPCAVFVLPAARIQAIEPGTVIAFGGMAEAPARIKDQIDAGEVFIADEASQQARDNFLRQYGDRIRGALALRDERLRSASLPGPVQAFIDESVGHWRLDRLSFSEGSSRFTLKPGTHRCLWWVPDAQGLAQLGVQAPGYLPADAAGAARRLGVPATVIYAGPALTELPAQPLCPGQKGLKLPPRP
jgi:hypothetical protein